MIRRIRLVRVGGDQGVAMVLVLGLTSVLVLLATAMVAVSIGSQRDARADQDWNAALSAAYAGVEEYQSRLANDPTYWTLGNPAARFSAAPTNVTLPTGTAANKAFSLTEWADVPGSGGAASFRYEVDNSKYYVDGTIRLRSTGRAEGQTRTIVADLRQKGFIDFLYFTDFEMQDPAFTGGVNTTCHGTDPLNPGRYAHGSSPRPTTGCAEIAFGTSDRLNGPVHSNDVIRACDSEFNGHTTTAYNPSSGARYVRRDSNYNSCTAPTFAVNGSGPAFQATIGMPRTNSELKKETRHDIPTEVPRPGCLYTGPTDITFLSNGKMRVISPWTRSHSSSPTAHVNPACGMPGSAGLGATTGSGSSRRYVGVEVDVPANNVVYVQNVPSLATDPNYAAPGRTPTGTSQIACASDMANNVGYPLSGESTPNASTSTYPAYGCRNGDVFVKGDLKGQLTVAAENFVYATGDIRYVDAQRDMLGLVGNNAVLVWNPMNGSNDNMLTDSSRRIDAAVLSVAHTFQVQNFDRGGDRGTLTINGAIAQKFRGVVRRGSNGYAKNYVYDQRFRYTAPPKFLSPVTTTYGVSVWAEVEPTFAPDGSYR